MDLGRQPNGPGQFIFGTVESKVPTITSPYFYSIRVFEKIVPHFCYTVSCFQGLNSVFRIDYSALNSTEEEREKYR